MIDLAVVELNNLKQQIWNMQMVPKIKFFFWRALSGAWRYRKGYNVGELRLIQHVKYVVVPLKQFVMCYSVAQLLDSF